MKDHPVVEAIRAQAEAVSRVAARGEGSNQALRHAGRAQGLSEAAGIARDILSPQPLTVAGALADLRVDAGTMYFRAVDPASHARKVAIYRVHRDAAYLLLQAGPPPRQLQQLVVEKYWKTDRVPRWEGLGGKVSLCWLPEAAELVSPTEVPPFGEPEIDKGETAE